MQVDVPSLCSTALEQGQGLHKLCIVGVLCQTCTIHSDVQHEMKSMYGICPQCFCFVELHTCPVNAVFAKLQALEYI